MRRSIAIAITATCLVAFSGCGGGSLSQPTVGPISAGNWVVMTTASNTNWGTQTRYIRGLLQSGSPGSSVSANMTVGGGVSTDACYRTTDVVHFSGSIDKNKVSLTADAIRDNVTTITAVLNSAANFDGTYTQTGNTLTNCQPVTGTVFATLVPSISGNWGGTLASSQGQGTNSLTASIVQSDASAATSDGAFPLSGTVSFSNYSCFTVGTIDSTRSYVAGELAVIVATSPDGTMLTLNTYFPNPSTAIQMNVKSSYTLSGGPCFSDSGTTGTLNKTS